MKYDLICHGSPFSEREPKALCGGVMIRLDLSYFLRLSANLTRLRFLRHGETIGEARSPLFDARAWLVSLGQDVTFGTSGARNTKAAIPALLNSIDALLGLDDGAELTFADYVALLNQLGTFEVLMLSDFSLADAYYVLEKEPYSTLSLVTKGWSLFPSDLVLKVPEAVADMQEAGKCIAFEVPTAAAFHVHRATETVLRRYWEIVTGNRPKPKTRSIGVFLRGLRDLGCGDSKVIAALSQMNELHRNPTIHPEDFLEMSEAIGLVGIANSVVAAMLKEIPPVDEDEPEIQFPPLSIYNSSEVT